MLAATDRRHGLAKVEQASIPRLAELGVTRMVELRCSLDHRDQE
jgi:hypothetical protein